MTAQTIYNIAGAAMRLCIDRYLILASSTKGFADVKREDFDDQLSRMILLAGKGVDARIDDPASAFGEWERRLAVPFDVESGVSFGVYEEARKRGDELYALAEKITDGFTSFSPEAIYKNPNLLPIWQHLGGIFSKAALKKQIGSVSDTSISRPAAGRIADLLKARVDVRLINRGEILKRLESTLEGIVRDLVGRMLLESIVDTSLRKYNIAFKREEEYASLSGVIYDFRADFVIPNENTPLAFIEVRKSSSRHASLYAKDKMFSAINWKGKNKDIIGVIVVDGEWTGETLKAMANIFDYVIPLSRVDELSDILRAYVEGDKTKLKWLVTFRIDRNAVS